MRKYVISMCGQWIESEGETLFKCSTSGSANSACEKLNRLHDENVKMQAVVDAAERASDAFQEDLFKHEVTAYTYNYMTGLREALNPKTPEQLQQERNDMADHLENVISSGRKDIGEINVALEAYQLAREAHEQCESQQ